MPDTKPLTGYPSIDKPWMKYYSAEDLEIKIPACTIYQNIYERNKDHPEDVAILYYGNKIRYKTLFSNVVACAKALSHVGIQKGDCVTLCTAGAPEAIYLVLACSQIGAIANFLNPLFTQEQMADRINETGANWVFVLDAMFSYIEAALPKTCIQNVVIIPATNSISPLLAKALYLKSEVKKLIRRGNGKQKFLGWKDFYRLSSYNVAVPDVPYQPGTPTVMVYSSGSTGASKGILLTNEGISATIANYTIHNMHINRGDTFLQMIPVWFSTGIVISVLMPLAKGAVVIPELKFSKETFLKDLIRYNPSVTLTATSLWLHVVNSGKKINLSNMKYPTSGGEKILPLDEMRINDYLKQNGCKTRLYKGYGMCELGSEITGDNDSPTYYGKLGGCGYPALGVTVSVFDISTGKELPYGKHGEIRAISPAQMKEYYKNPEATADFFKPDEHGTVWGCTGDIGYMDKDGEVFVLGRSTDNYRRDNGEIVYLFDIEEEILADDSVAQCKVVDTEIENEKCLVAHIVFRPEIKDKNNKLIRIYKRLAHNLPDYIIPEYYKIRSSMPVHTNGKRDTGTLRKDRDSLISAKQLVKTDIESI